MGAEHYTDTHGYTEINFTAFGMIGTLEPFQSTRKILAHEVA